MKRRRGKRKKKEDDKISDEKDGKNRRADGVKFEIIISYLQIRHLSTTRRY